MPYGDHDADMAMKRRRYGGAVPSLQEIVDQLGEGDDPVAAGLTFAGDGVPREGLGYFDHLCTLFLLGIGDVDQWQLA